MAVDEKGPSPLSWLVGHVKKMNDEHEAYMKMVSEQMDLTGETQLKKIKEALSEEKVAFTTKGLPIFQPDNFKMHFVGGGTLDCPICDVLSKKKAELPVVKDIVLTRKTELHDDEFAKFCQKALQAEMLRTAEEKEDVEVHATRLGMVEQQVGRVKRQGTFNGMTILEGEHCLSMDLEERFYPDLAGGPIRPVFKMNYLDHGVDGIPARELSSPERKGLTNITTIGFEDALYRFGPDPKFTYGDRVLKDGRGFGTVTGIYHTESLNGANGGVFFYNTDMQNKDDKMIPESLLEKNRFSDQTLGDIPVKMEEYEIDFKTGAMKATVSVPPGVTEKQLREQLDKNPVSVGFRAPVHRDIEFGPDGNPVMISSLDEEKVKIAEMIKEMCQEKDIDIVTAKAPERMQAEKDEDRLMRAMGRAQQYEPKHTLTFHLQENRPAEHIEFKFSVAKPKFPKISQAMKDEYRVMQENCPIVIGQYVRILDVPNWGDGGWAPAEFGFGGGQDMDFVNKGVYGKVEAISWEPGTMGYMVGILSALNARIMKVVCLPFFALEHVDGEYFRKLKHKTPGKILNPIDGHERWI